MQSGLVLASASLRRQKILSGLGARFEVLVPQVEEISGGLEVRTLVAENARRKYAWCRERRPDSHIIAADTVVLFDGKVIGKPRSRREAVRCLRRFSGACHEVLTASVLGRPGSAPETRLDESNVFFRELTTEHVREYLALVNPLDKAGAYDIDDHGELLVSGWSGSRTNVMGLPVETVEPWLRREGLL